MLRKLLALAVLCVGLASPVYAQQQFFVQQSATVTVAATTSSGNVALGYSGQSVWVCNQGTTLAYIAFGGSAIAATSSSTPIPGGVCAIMSPNSNTYAAAIMASSTATISFTPGAGAMVATGGGGSGSGGTQLIDCSSSANTLCGLISAAAPCQSFTTATTSTPVSSNTVNKIGCDLNGNLTLSPNQLASLTSPAPTQGTYFYNKASSVLTRIANATPYAANETVCLFTSVTVCAPMTATIALTGQNQGNFTITHFSLLKSGTSTTNATFNVWLYSAAPGTATPNQFDATSYTGPRAADLPNFMGVAQCTSPTVTSDTTVQVWYECALSNPNTGGAVVGQALSGALTINALISVTAAYTPASGETFQFFASGFY